MNIHGLQKLTLLDFPGNTACTVFTGGCNLRCPFCHNASLVRGTAPAVDTEELFALLKKRRGVLDGVCISGGEPLLQTDIADFIKEIRALGYKVKLDTNGSLPQRLKPLLKEKLLDYVAMDLKNAPYAYGKTVGIEGFDFAPVAESMSLLRASHTPYEYRTTVCYPLHTMESLLALRDIIRSDEPWFLQQYIDSGDVLGSGLDAYPPEEMQAFLSALTGKNPLVRLRGL